MPSRLPRMSLTLPKEVSDAVNDLADAMGKPSTKVVTELLQDMVPQLQGLAKIARAGKLGNKAAAKRALTEMVGDAMAEVAAMSQPELFGKGKGSKS